jgi:hypothetical protein
MSLEEEGAYRRALDFCWLHGSLPNDLDRLARIIGKGASTTLARVVQAMFDISEDGTCLTHPRLEAERLKQRHWKEKSRAGGKKSASKRLDKQKSEPNGKGGSTTLARVVEPPLQGSLENGSNQNATLQSSSSSAFANTNTPPPARAPEDWRSSEFESHFGKPLPTYQLDLAQGKVEDRTLWVEVLSKWKANGYSERNFTGLLDFYEREQERKDGEILRRQHRERNASHSAPAGIEVIPFEAREGSL